MDDVLHAATQLQWTEVVVTAEEIEEKYGYPQIVKATAETSTIYDLPEDETLLLASKRNPIRLLAQTVEEGHYVMGKQLDIPSEFSGVFKISCDYDREDISLQTFRSIQEVSDAFPPKVYAQEQLTVTLASDDNSGKFITVVLEKGDELKVLSRLESQSGQSVVSKPASMFISRVRRLQHNFLAVHCSRLDETLSLPMSIQGWFATRPPLFVHLMERKGIISLQQIMEQADFPLTVTVSTNSTRSVKDDFVLRTGMHLKLLGLEEHNLVLAVAPFQKIFEFSSIGTTFKLPAVLTNSNATTKEHVAAKNQYQTYVQSAFMNSKLQNSPSSIEDYCSAVRFHVPRNRNPTNPRPLNSNAYLRNLTLSAQQQRKATINQGISAIQLLSSQPAENLMQRDKRMSSRQSGSLRRQLPTPEMQRSISPVSGSNPPLPPRNSPLPYTPNIYGNINAPNIPGAPPVPPKNRAPPPPSCEPLSLSSALKNHSSPHADMPIRQPPLPNIPNSSTQQPLSNATTTNGYDPSAEESIFEEFVPRSLVTQTSNGETNLFSAFGSNDSPLLLPTDPTSATFNAASADRSHVIPASPLATSIQSRSDSPCFTINSTLAKPFEVPELYEASEPSHLADMVQNENPYTAAAADDSSEAAADEANGSCHSTPESITTQTSTATESESEKYNTSDQGSITFPINGMESDTDASHEGQSSSEEQQPRRSHPNRGSSTAKEYFPAPSNWHPPSDIASMDVEEVAKSLRYIGISENVVLTFRQEMIDGYMLVELTDDILEDDFHLSKLYRFKIKRFIQGWRPKLSTSQ